MKINLYDSISCNNFQSGNFISRGLEKFGDYCISSSSRQVNNGLVVQLTRNENKLEISYITQIEAKEQKLWQKICSAFGAGIKRIAIFFSPTLRAKYEHMYAGVEEKVLLKGKILGLNDKKIKPLGNDFACLNALVSCCKCLDCIAHASTRH